MKNEKGREQLKHFYIYELKENTSTLIVNTKQLKFAGDIKNKWALKYCSKFALNISQCTSQWTAFSNVCLCLF